MKKAGAEFRKFLLVSSTATLIGGCSRARTDEVAPAPTDTSLVADSTRVPDTAVATPPINPSPSGGSAGSAPSGPPAPAADSGQGGTISRLEYEGWRQYSVQCARCHGQDALPNPVAANLLLSLAPGGPTDSLEKFAQVVNEGIPERGMPAFKDTMTPDQIHTVYAYLKGRAGQRIPPGRPQQPSG